MAENKRLSTPKGRLSFPYLFKARPKDPKAPADAKDKFSLSLIFDAAAQKTPEWAAIREECRRLADEKFGVNVKQADGTVKRFIPKGIKNPIKDGGDKMDKDGVTPMKGYGPGTVYISATSTEKPGVIDGAMQKVTDEKAVYAGCYARATITVYSFDRPDSKGIALGLRNVQKMAEGEPFGGGGDPTKDFAPVEGYESSSTSAGGDFGTPAPAGATAAATPDVDDLPF